MDHGIISFIRCQLVDEWEEDGTRDDVLSRHHFVSLQIWSMDSDEPVHSFKDSVCWSLAWRPNGKTEDVDGGIDAARKSKENLTIAW